MLTCLRTITQATALLACLTSVAVGCGPPIPPTRKPLPTSPAIKAEVSDPFVLPAYSDDEEGLAAAVPTGVLMKLLEPSFVDSRNQNLEAYRCTVRGSGVGVPEGYPTTYSVRAVRAGDGGLALVVKIAPDHRCRPRLTWWTARGSSEQWGRLARRVEQAGLWASSGSKKLVVDAVDGSTWTLEGLRDGRLQAMATQNPDSGDPIHAPCVYLFALAGGFAEPICD